MKRAPWTPDEVESANAYQKAGITHEFTSGSGVVLVATPEGWRERPDGPVVQDWAHGFMLDWSWQPRCLLCGKPRRAWQRFCGAACSAQWEAGKR